MVICLSLLIGTGVLAVDQININTAGMEELDTIPEVGPSTAAKIIAYREANGPFAAIEDIMQVSGIKEATFAKMKDYLTVGSGALEDDEPDDAEFEAELDSTAVSAHSGSEELTALVKKEALKIGAGRSRVVVVGAPVPFVAALNLPVGRVRCEWSFGDGGKRKGCQATHAYYFPGFYNVVLNARLGEEEVSAKTEVQVIEPELMLAVVAGGIKIKNPTKEEVNLGAWRLVSDDQSFVIPADTLLLSGGTTIIPFEISGLALGEHDRLALHNPAGRISARDQVQVAELARLQSQLAEVRAQLLKLVEVQVRSKSLVVTNPPSVLQSSGVPIATTSSSTIELVRKRGWWVKLVDEIF